MLLPARVSLESTLNLLHTTLCHTLTADNEENPVVLLKPRIHRPTDWALNVRTDIARNQRL